MLGQRRHQSRELVTGQVTLAAVLPIFVTPRHGLSLRSSQFTARANMVLASASARLARVGVAFEMSRCIPSMSARRTAADVAYSYEELGNVCLGLDQNEEARRYFERALERNSKLPASWYGLAKIDRADKRYPDALKALDEAKALAPQSVSVHYLRAQTLMQLGRKAEAETEFAAVRRLQQEKLDNLERQIMGTRYQDPQLATDQK